MKITDRVIKMMIKQNVRMLNEAPSQEAMDALMNAADSADQSMENTAMLKKYVGDPGNTIYPNKAANTDLYVRAAKKAKAESNTAMLSKITAAAQLEGPKMVDMNAVNAAVQGATDAPAAPAPAAAAPAAPAPAAAAPAAPAPAADAPVAPAATPTAAASPKAAVKQKPKAVPTSPETTNNVKVIQSQLAKNGYNIKVDGIYGPATQGAVNALFKKYGVKDKGHANFASKVSEEASEVMKLTGPGGIAAKDQNLVPKDPVEDFLNKGAPKVTKEGKVIFNKSYIQKIIKEELRKLLG